MAPVSADEKRDRYSVSIVIPYSPAHTPVQFMETAKQSVKDQPHLTEILVVRDEEQRGPGWARNRGLEIADNRFVAFLDADDRWKEGSLSRQFSRIEETGNSACVQGPPIPNVDQFIKNLLLGNYPAPTSGFLIDTDVVQASFDESLAHGEDHLFMIEAAVQGGICACDDLVEVRRHSDSITSESGYNDEYVTKQHQLLERVRQVTDLPMEVIEQFLANTYYIGGRLEHANGNHRTAIDHFSTSLRHQFRVKTAGALAVSMCGNLKTCLR